ncbi:hypothetical protein [Streptomyces sp. SBT349]|uniref:hypothetical protein n=1 Tax=Streptomyces sp. SBT349 TaxID=1580539 RepID=UPI00131E680D|nr:hypothetical protein [Streptomyces sp. SBT349]
MSTATVHSAGSAAGAAGASHHLLGGALRAARAVRVVVGAVFDVVILGRADAEAPEAPGAARAAAPRYASSASPVTSSLASTMR